jgi:hypothetical protein
MVRGLLDLTSEMDAEEVTRWFWARSPGGVRLEVAPRAMVTLLVLDDATQQRLQHMLFEIADTSEPRSWPRVPLLLTLGRTTVRYSLDAPKLAIVIDHVVTPEERAG